VQDERRTLAVFAKAPAAGAVKTRLARRTSPEWAARVAEAFVTDLVCRLADFPARRVLACAPPDGMSYFEGLATGRFALVPQGEGDLGRRLEAFLAAELARGAEAVVVLGTDSPTVPLEHIARAFDLLGRADVVLGPAADGGYYLLGCARRVPPLFDGVEWGGPRVLLDTVARAGAAGLCLALLPPWYDVDTLDDWWALCGHLAALRLAGADPGVPHTEALCREAPPLSGT
jgi:rSAM/selenodomain-associated transferase 1